MGETIRRLNNSDLTGSVPATDRRPGFRAVGVAISKVTLPIITARGGGILVRLKSDWAAIVGPDWADATWPTALGRDGALKLRAAPGAALEAQHRAPLLIERINGFFGRPVVSRLALVQGPLPLPPRPRSRLPRQLAAVEVKALDERLADIADSDLREALAQLGRSLISREG
jgi:hypothetical protein